MTNPKKRSKMIPFNKNNKQPPPPPPKQLGEITVTGLPEGTQWFLVLPDQFVWSGGWRGLHELVGFVRVRLRRLDAVEEEIIQAASRPPRSPLPPPPLSPETPNTPVGEEEPDQIDQEDPAGDEGELFDAGPGYSPEEIQAEINRLQSLLPK